MQLLHLGSRGFIVEYAQRLINRSMDADNVAGEYLNEDGRFGPATVAAVRAFQQRHAPLVVDGVIGPMTWRALGLRVEVEHNRVIQFGQPTNSSCWSAAATEILGNMSVGPGGATIEPDGGLTPTIDNLIVFARTLGWTMLNMSPTSAELVNRVQQSPIWVAELGATFKHAVVFSAVYSDGGRRGEGTMFRIHDPWPVGRGRIYGTFGDNISILADDNVTRLRATDLMVLIPA